MTVTGKPADALSAIDSLSDGDKAYELPAIATGFAQLDDWHAANQIVRDEIRSNEAKAKALYGVLVVRYTKNDPERQNKLLEEFFRNNKRGSLF